MITAPTPTLPSVPLVTPDRLQGSIAALADIASSTGRDAAAGLLQGILRDLRAAGRIGG